MVSLFLQCFVDYFTDGTGCFRIRLEVMVLSICSKLYGMLYKGWVSMKWRDDGRDALRNNTLNSFNDFLCILFRRKVLTQRQWQIRGHEDRKTLSAYIYFCCGVGFEEIKYFFFRCVELWSDHDKEIWVMFIYRDFLPE